jgi:uncharacterized protein
MRMNPVGWFEIYVDDMERAKAFYEGMLEVELQPLGGPDLEMWSFPMDENGPGISGALTRFEGFGPGPGGTVVYFACEDCAAGLVQALRDPQSAGDTVELAERLLRESELRGGTVSECGIFGRHICGILGRR